MLFFAFATAALGQSPQRISYQAVIRNSAGEILKNRMVGTRISLLRGSINGNTVYVETHLTQTNQNGLLSVEIGSGLAKVGNLSEITWSDGLYYIKSETDVNGGSNYTFTITSQILSVPYALHASTAEKLINPPAEKDPLFTNSVAGQIKATDTARWNNKQNKLSIAGGLILRNDTLQATLTESDPLFKKSVAESITTKDTSKWNNKQDKFILGNGLQWNSDTLSEVDPLFVKSVAAGISAKDTANWNSKQSPLKAGSGISISAGTISTTGSSGGFSRYIGEYYGGGVIFHLWKDTLGKEHGLIMGTSDLSKAQSFSNVSNTLIGTNAQELGDGLKNSNAIVSQSGHISSAAQLCLNATSGGQTDWYLPAIDELSMIWHNRFTLNKALLNVKGGEPFLLDVYYCSSTEYSQNYVMYCEFFGGRVTNYLKTYQGRVRAVRSF